MSRAATGEVTWRSGRYITRHIIARPKTRQVVPLPWTQLSTGAREEEHRAHFEALARERSKVLGQYASRLRDKGFAPPTVGALLQVLAQHAPGAAHSEAVQRVEKALTKEQLSIPTAAAHSLPDVLLRETIRSQGAEDQMPATLHGISHFAVSIEESRAQPTITRTVAGLGGWRMSDFVSMSGPDGIPRVGFEFVR